MTREARPSCAPLGKDFETSMAMEKTMGEIQFYNFTILQIQILGFLFQKAELSGGL